MSGSGDERALVRGWLEAATRADVRAAIARVHDGIAREVASRAPVCEQSGRCCRFEEYGHRLYVTGLEAAATLLGAGLIDRDKILYVAAGAPGEPVTPDDVAAGSCPLSLGRACGVHGDRPTGCRVFYCDPTWAPIMGDVSERAVGEIRAVHERFGVAYRYAEWRGLLGMFGVTGPIFAEPGEDQGGFVRVRIETDGGMGPGREGSGE